MQKLLKIKTKDNHFIYGNLCVPNKKADRLVIFCHGFTGNRNEHQFFNGSKFFVNKGYNTFRFNFYGDEKKQRHFEETNISQHGSDITTVVNYFKNKYQKIYLVGHSYGGTSILFSDTHNVSAVVFWDASYVIGKNEKKAPDLIKKEGRYFINWGINIEIGKKFIQELFNFSDCGALVKQIQKPIKFIGAGKGVDAKKYYKEANNPKKIIVISGADHGFNSAENEERLFQETHEWIKRF